MIINKNWFYKIRDIKDDVINVEAWIVAYFYDDCSSSKKIYLWEKSFVEFYWFLNIENNKNLEFFQDNDFSNLKVKYLLLSKNDNKIKTKIHSKISSDNSQSDLKIISLVWEKWDIDLDWIIEIDYWFKKIVWHLHEENIFLWNSWKIKWIPTLLVRSDDVEASHACVIEKISDEKLFYLRSRWILEKNALNMLIESKINSLFSCLSMVEKDFSQKLIDNIIFEIDKK